MTNPAAQQADDRLLGWNIAGFARAKPQQLALIYGNHTWNYAQFHQAIGIAAAGLQGAGITRGDVVVMAGTARPEALFTMFGLARIGAVVAPLHPSSTAHEIRSLAETIKPAATIGGSDFLTDNSIPGPRLSWDDSGPGQLRADIDLPPVENWCGDPLDTAILALTSGSSGRPKGVLLSHSNLYWGARNTSEALDITANDRVLIATPLTHVAAFGGLAHCAWTVGGSVILASRFDPDDFIAAVHGHHVTASFVVPAMLARLVRNPRWSTMTDTALRWLLVGGAPPIETLTKAIQETGIGVINSYGLTEASGGVTYALPHETETHPLSAGTPVNHIELFISNDEGERVAEPGYPGQIWLRGPSTAGAYLSPDGNRNPTTNDAGWLATGDWGVLDHDGRLNVIGRMTDTIVTGGENVDPAEIENVLMTIAGIREVAVIGLPDPEWGQKITAVIIPEPGITLSLNDLRPHLELHLSRHKLPRCLISVDSIPRTATSKLRRAELINQIMSRSEDLQHTGKLSSTEPPTLDRD